MILDLLLLVSVIGILIAAAVYDKQRRAIPKALTIITLIISAAGALCNLVILQQTQYIIPSAIALGVWFLLHLVNIFVMKKGHQRLVGGADLNVYICVSLCIPTLCNLYTSVWLIPVTIIFVAFGRLIPKTETDCKERGTPFLYFMLIAFLFMLLMHCLLCGFTFW